MYKPTICIDFDGVLHSYTSGWKGATTIPDSPVPGAIEWLVESALSGKAIFVIYSSRSKDEGGAEAMEGWLRSWIFGYFKGKGVSDVPTAVDEVMSLLVFPTQKPAAQMTIDDRAHCFTGKFRPLEWYLNFKPWNKRTPEENVPEYNMTGCAEDDENLADEALETLQECLLTDVDGFTTFEGSALEYLATFFRDVRTNAAAEVIGGRGVVERIARALKVRSGCCLDTEEERKEVLETIMDALYAPQGSRASWVPTGEMHHIQELLRGALRPTEVPDIPTIAGWTEEQRIEVRDWGYACSQGRVPEGSLPLVLEDYVTSTYKA